MSDFWAPTTYPKARKPHRCVTCYRVIDAGEVYCRGFGIYDGRPNDWKQCAHCEAMLPYIDYDDTYSEDDYVCWEPANLEQLRIRVHLNKKWRDNAGNLYPIPFQRATA